MTTQSELTTESSFGAAPSHKARSFVVSRQDSQTRAFTAVGILTALPVTFSFEYLGSFLSSEQPLGLGGLPLAVGPFVSERLFPVFAQRIIGAHRVDRPENLESLGLSLDSSDLEILSRSEGARPVDSIRLTELPDTSTGKIDLKFFVHGVRYQKNIESVPSELHIGDCVELVRETENPFDEYATLVTTQGKTIGYVPSALSVLISAASDFRGQVSHVNPASFGSNLRVLIHVQGSVDSQFLWPWQVNVTPRS